MSVSPAPKASPGWGLLGLVPIAPGNLLAFPDAAGFLRSVGAHPVWHKPVCFTLFFNVGIFHKTSFRQLQPCLSVFSRGFCMLAITNLHPNSKVFATTSSARGSSNLSLFAQLENCLVLLSLEIKYCNYNRYYFNYFNRWNKRIETSFQRLWPEAGQGKHCAEAELLWAVSPWRSLTAKEKGNINNTYIEMALIKTALVWR